MSTHSIYRSKQGGYIALMATIVISLVLLVMIINEGFAGWMTRFVVLGTEAKEQANALAEGCADQALASLITDTSYMGNTTSQTPGGNCKVFGISAADLAAGVVTIKTQAVVREAFANLELLQTLNNIHLGNIPTAPTYGTLIVQTLVTDTSKVSSEFDMHVSGPAGTAPNNGTLLTFQGSASGRVVRIPTPISAPISTYSVSESPVPGYAATFSSACSGTIKGGDIKSCTVTNSPVTTTLTLIANVSNNDSTGTRAPGDIALFIDGTAAVLGRAYTVSAGSHTVTATLPGGYSASAWGYQCSGAIGAGTASLNLGDNKICIINLDDNPPPAPSCAETVMMLDRSGSMFTNSAWIPDEKAAAKALVDLYAGVANFDPLISFGRFGDLSTGVSAEIVSLLTSNYAAVKTAIDNGLPENPISYTNLAAAIQVSNAELNGPRHEAGKEQVLILISDGDPNQPSSGADVQTGFFAPSGNTQDSSGELWSNPANAYSQGAGVATDPVSENDQHRFYNFNIPTIPSNATIRGIEARFDAWASTTNTVPVAGNSQRSPSAAAAPNQWASAASALTSDNTYATSATLNQQQGFSNFGFAIPSNATITGIQVTTEARVSGGGSTGTTPTLLPGDEGYVDDWNGNDDDVDESGTPSCSSTDSIIENGSNQRHSFEVSLSAVPTGATITSVDITVYDKADNSAGGTYKTFARLNNSNTDAVATLAASATGGSSTCSSAKTQNIDVTDTVKSNSTDLEIGVIKINSGGSSNNTVRVGAIRATVNYTVLPTGSLSVALSHNGGTNFTSAKNVSFDTTESVETPSGNSSSDLWGRSWTPPNFSDGNFVVRVQNTSATGVTTSLDHVRVQVFYTTPTPASVSCQLEADLSWNGGSSWSDAKQQTLTGAETTYVFGSATDDWESGFGAHTWVPSDFANGSNRFVVRVRASDPGSSCDNAAVANLDILEAQVHYEVPTTPSEAALLAADAAKQSGTSIFTIHFGDASGRNFLAQLASGSTPNGTHQPGSYNDPGSITSSNSNWVSPTSQSADTGGDNNGFESNPTNAFTDGSGSATNNNGEDDRHRYAGYQLNIPPGATITGIETRLDWWTDSTSGTNELRVELSWNGGSSWSSARDADNESTNSGNNETIGGSTDTWGRTWSASDLSSTNFRVRVTSECSGSSSCNSRDFYLDWLPVRVHYMVNSENGDGDNFFIAPTSADMKGIFEFIGNQVCPAINNVSAVTPPTTASLLIITRSDAPVGSGITTTVNVTGQNPSVSSYTASGVADGAPNQTSVTVTSDAAGTAYNIVQTAVAGYTQSRTDSCSSTLSTPIIAGEVRTCVLTNTKIPPPPEAPPLTITPGSWQEVPDTTP